MQRHRSVDPALALEERDAVTPLGHEVGEGLTDPGLGVGLGGEPLSREVAGDLDLRTVGVL